MRRESAKPHKLPADNHFFRISRDGSDRFSLRVLAFVAVFSLCLAAAAQISSTVPRVLRIEGTVPTTIIGAEGAVIHVTASLYTTQSSAAPLWSEEHDLTVSSDGSYALLLGSRSEDGVPLEFFQSSSAHWLGMRLDTGEELPRVLLVSSSYALKAADADTLGGRPLAAFVLRSAEGSSGASVDSVQASSVAAHSAEVASNAETSSVTATGGTPNYLARFIDAAVISTSSIVDDLLGVGIGVASPTQHLDVFGRVKLRARGDATSGLWLTDTAGNEQLFLGQIGLESYSPLGVWHGGAWRLSLTSAGDLGLGVGAFPNSRFDIAGRMILRASEQGTAGMWLTDAAGTRKLFFGQKGISSDDALGIWHNNDWRFTLNNRGDIGIGVDPQFRLDVLGRLRLRAYSGQPGGAWFSGESDTPELFLGQTDVSAAAPFGILHGGSWRFVLQRDGNIGIGTISPRDRLEVAGNVRLSGNLIFSDGTYLASSGALSTTIKSNDPALQVSRSGNEYQLSFAPGALTNSYLADSAVSTAKLADGSVTTGKLGAIALPPTAIVGTAATLGANTFLSPQTFNAPVTLNDNLQVNGSSLFGNIFATTANIADNVLLLRHTATSGATTTARAETMSSSGIAVVAVASSSTGSTVGLHAHNDSAQGVAVIAEADSASGANIGIRATNRSTGGTAIRAEATALSGTTYGIYSTTSGTDYAASIFADALSTSSAATNYGVYARSAGAYGVGIYASATHATGSTYGIYARTASPSGVAGAFSSTAASGNIVAAYANTKRVFRVDVGGNIFLNGTVQTGGADFAENVAVTERENLEAGDVLVIDELADRSFSRSREPYSTRVAGIVSTHPGVVGSRAGMVERGNNELPLAVVGIVPCKVSAESGPIRRGDLLVTAATPGHAMRADDPTRTTGAILGKALGNLEAGTGIIEVLVSLQ